jgi:hypothetical protein
MSFLALTLLHCAGRLGAHKFSPMMVPALPGLPDFQDSKSFPKSRRLASNLPQTLQNHRHHLQDFPAYLSFSDLLFGKPKKRLGELRAIPKLFLPHAAGRVRQSYSADMSLETLPGARSLQPNSPRISRIPSLHQDFHTSQRSQNILQTISDLQNFQTTFSS